MKKKVLIVIFSLYNGGAEKSLVNMLNELPVDKYEIDLMLFKKEGMFLKQVPEWVNIIDTPENLKKLYLPMTKSGNMLSTKVMGTLISKFKESGESMQKGYRWKHFYGKKIQSLPKKYDVAIAYTSGESMFFVGDKVEAGKKLVWIHNDFRSAKHPKKYDHEYFKDMGLVTISNECARIIEDEFSDLNKKVSVIANITSSRVTRSRAEEFYPEEFSKEDFRILSVGRLMGQKGFDIAIEAAAILKERKITFKWYIIGDGKLKDELSSMIKEKQLEEYVYLIGPRENPYPYMKHCDLFAQTSRFEGKSVVLDEAKILGAPIIVTRYPTVIDQVEDKKEGCIVDIAPGAIAEGIEKMIGDSELRENIRNYLLAHDYGNQDEIQKYMDIIDS